MSLTVLAASFLLPMARADAAGDALGQRVADRAGDPYALEELRFSFVVRKDDREMARRVHVWHPQTGAVEVSWGSKRVQLVDIRERDLSALVADPAAHADAWLKAAPDASADDAAQAWAWFVNDSYWLLAPSKVMDPGVTRVVGEDGRLGLTFDAVGLTPGDQYWLHVDAASGDVVRWDLTLQGGKEGSFAWSEPVVAGSMHLMTRRISDKDGFEIHLVDVSAR